MVKILKRKYIIIRVPKLVFGYRLQLGDIWSHFYGILGIIGLTITIIYTWNAYKLFEDKTEFQKIIESLSYSIITVIFVFVFSSVYYIVRLERMRKYKHDFQSVEKELYDQKLINKYMSECMHSITHHHRDITARLYQTITDTEKLDENQMKDLKNEFNNFLVIVTSSLQNLFSFTTQDNCSVTIKLLDETQEYAYTFFRDPINYNKRHQYDKKVRPKGKAKISENLSYKIIMDPKLTNVFYYNNDLSLIYESHQYRNPNEDWHKYYNATLVVPISLLLSEDKRDYIGFLSVDNFKGNLANEESLEFLFAVGDLLYNVFVKYKKIF